MGAERGGDATPQPSEPLCELALELAAELDAYERRGGTDILGDVVMREPYIARYHAAESNVGRQRPGWRWDIVLRHGAHTEIVVGTPNGGWHVETIILLRGLAPHPERGSVLVDSPGSEDGLALPPADEDSPANRAIIGGATSVGFLAGGGIGMVVGRLLGRSVPGMIRTPKWHPDPSGGHALRYWNGIRWTRFVYSVNNGADPTDSAADSASDAPER